MLIKVIPHLFVFTHGRDIEQMVQKRQHCSERIISTATAGSSTSPCCRWRWSDTKGPRRDVRHPEVRQKPRGVGQKLWRGSDTPSAVVRGRGGSRLLQLFHLLSGELRYRCSLSLSLSLACPSLSYMPLSLLGYPPISPHFQRAPPLSQE